MHHLLDLLFSNTAAWFGVPAVVGSAFFLLRMAIMLLGGEIGHGDFDVGHGGDLHHGDPGDAFKLFSVQSIAAFLMGFGWGGLAGFRGADWPLVPSTLFAFGTGLGMMWLLAMLLRAMVSLQSSGNVRIADAVGAEADVYVTVPAQGQGRGQVTVVVNDRQRILNAISDGEPLPTKSRVRITRANEDNTVTVSPL